MVESQTNPNFHNYHYDFVALLFDDPVLANFSKKDLNQFNALLGRIYALKFDKSNSEVREGVVSFSEVPNSRYVLNVILENLTRLSPEKLNEFGIGIKEMIFLIKLFSFLDKSEFQLELKDFIDLLADLLAKIYCATGTYKNMVKKAIKITNDTSPIFLKNTFVKNFLLKLGYIFQIGKTWFILGVYEKQILALRDNITFSELVVQFILSDTSLVNRIVGQDEANQAMQQELYEELKKRILAYKDDVSKIARSLAIIFDDLQKEAGVRDFLKSITEISLNIEQIIMEWKEIISKKVAEPNKTNQGKTAISL